MLILTSNAAAHACLEGNWPRLKASQASASLLSLERPPYVWIAPILNELSNIEYCVLWRFEAERVAGGSFSRPFVVQLRYALFVIHELTFSRICEADEWSEKVLETLSRRVYGVGRPIHAAERFGGSAAWLREISAPKSGKPSSHCLRPE
ncbi:uncharacterized protein BO88DRAFT_475174 [Aspergillus vadensis CBS 113365]|uniref:Uncharacterized protein n=2 Tax=Aspergillus subgen. Circumdati TaxID=2720871 RepID=A0A319BKX2_ASPVC|nr:hypothetical protein BO88DRAFT_475174 [Aspergillus vadensis CBS 113365]OJZ80275.1 hypothetical protein ASPFODRAFT_461904 [Aspergillus luchuensis CBS 106.47]PYH63948.1 hypothetical protein BO88DRAFT_475174 [Aspergillus vadensis CBS 113365]